MTRRLLGFALVAPVVMASAQQTPGRSSPAPAAATLIKNATIMTVTKGTMAGSDILLQNGRIAAIGKNLTPPAGATVIDATGKYVSPGIIDPHSHMMSDATNEGTLSVTSMVRIQDVLNPTAVNIYRALAGGVTTINVLHGSANTIGGQNAVVKLKWGEKAKDMLFPGAMPGIKFALGENVTRKNSQVAQQATGQAMRYPTTRMGQAEILRDAFTRARDYKATWDEYNARVAKGEKNVIPPRRDLELEPLVEVLEGKRLVHAHSYNADEIMMLASIAKEFGFKVATFQHALDAYKVASEIAAAGSGVSTFADEWSYKIEAYDAIPYNPAILMRHGVVTTINSDSDERVRRLNIDAAKMMRYGDLTEDEAMKLITYNGALQLGIQDKVGSLEVGKDADVVIWSGHPLSVYSSAETTFIDGQIYFDKKFDLANRDKTAKERAALLAEEQGRRIIVP
jgi:imidazolonepropionase-like amidohydrolase